MCKKMTYVVFVVSVLVTTGQAAEILWSDLLVEDVPEVNGVVLEAVNGGGPAVTVGDVNFVNGHTFDANDANAPVIAYSNLLTAFPNDWNENWGSAVDTTGDPNLDIMLAGHRWSGGTDTVDFMLTNLTPGLVYQIQLYMADNRSCCSGRAYHYEDLLGNASAVFARGDNVSLIGTFTADDVNQVIQYVVEEGSKDPGLSGYVLAVQQAEILWSDLLVEDVPEVNGIVLEAVNGGGPAVTVGDVNFVNGHTFDPNDANAPVIAYSNLLTALPNDWNENWGSAADTTGDPNLDIMLAGHRWSGGTDTVDFVLTNLTPGLVYEIQLYMTDNRGCCGARAYHYEDLAGNASAVFARNDNVSLIGTFEAVAPSQLIKYVVEEGSKDPGLSGYVLSEIVEE